MSQAEKSTMCVRAQNWNISKPFVFVKIWIGNVFCTFVCQAMPWVLSSSIPKLSFQESLKSSTISDTLKEMYPGLYLKEDQILEQYAFVWLGFYIGITLYCSFLFFFQFFGTLLSPLSYIMEKIEHLIPAGLWHQLTHIWVELGAWALFSGTQTFAPL